MSARRSEYKGSRFDDDAGGATVNSLEIENRWPEHESLGWKRFGSLDGPPLEHLRVRSGAR